MQETANKSKFALPLYVQVLAAVVLGSLFGVFFGKDSAHYLANASLGDIGYAAIRLLKILAIPLILFAIIDTILKTEVTGKTALKVISISLVNVSVAMVIGLTILNIFQPGRSWIDKISPAKVETKQFSSDPTTANSQQQASPPAHSVINSGSSEMSRQELDPIKILTKLIPNSLLDPFIKNNTLSVIIIGLLFGFAFRGLRNDGLVEQLGSVSNFVDIMFKAILKVIGYVIRIIPIGIFCLVAAAVGKSGIAIFSTLWIFLATICAGFFIHAFVYYPLVAWVIGKKPPRIYLGRGLDAILTAFSTNSSLATVPVTLRTLTERMGVSDRSARMSACFATNLNNDGITLYEAMTAIFLTQALGYNLPISTQVFIAAVAVFVSMGIAGIPEAGLIILPLVLGVSGFSDEMIAVAVALIIPIDWFIARLRSVVNVMSDMAVAIVLEKL